MHVNEDFKKSFQILKHTINPQVKSLASEGRDDGYS